LQARSAALSQEDLFKKALVIGVLRARAWWMSHCCVAVASQVLRPFPYPSRRERHAFVIFLCIVNRRILLLRMMYYIILSCLCGLNFLGDPHSSVSSPVVLVHWRTAVYTAALHLAGSKSGWNVNGSIDRLYPSTRISFSRAYRRLIFIVESQLQF
jgi:hypothetical protein